MVTPDAARESLLMVMEWWSRDMHAAGWYGGLEYDLWRRAVAREGAIGQLLRYLSQRAGGWWVYDDAANDRRFLPLDEWERRYAQSENKARR